MYILPQSAHNPLLIIKYAHKNFDCIQLANNLVHYLSRDPKSGVMTRRIHSQATEFPTWPRSGFTYDVRMSSLQQQFNSNSLAAVYWVAVVSR